MNIKPAESSSFQLVLFVLIISVQPEAAILIYPPPHKEHILALRFLLSLGAYFP